MLKLETTEAGGDSDEGIDNSFAECGSEEDSEESDSDGEASEVSGEGEAESEEESRESPVRK